MAARWGPDAGGGIVVVFPSTPVRGPPMRTTATFTRRLRALVDRLAEALAADEGPQLPPVTGWPRQDSRHVR